MHPRILSLYLATALCVQPVFAQKRPAPARSSQRAAIPGQSGRYPIVELTTTGSERYDAEDILKATRLKKNKSVDVSLDDVKAAAQRLADSGAFARVSYKHTAAPGGMKVEFELGDKDDDQFVKCDFANIVWLPENDLLIELHDRVPLFNGTVPRDGGVADDVSKALQALLKEREVAANVADEHQDAANGDPATESITFRVANIDIKVAKVELTGASPVMQAEADTAGKKITGLIYNRGTVKHFMEHNLRNVYLKHGYLRVTMGEPEIKVLPGPSGPTTDISINIPVTEGRVYQAHDVRWSGNKAMLSQSLSPYLHLAPGAVVDGARLKQDIDNVRLDYAARGYLHMILDAKPAFNEEAGTVDYQMVVREGELFSMGKFDVQGVDKPSAERMRQTWRLREGQPFDPTYVKEFFKGFRLPAGAAYMVDEVEGELPRSIDVTVIICAPTDPCKPKNENRLYTPPKAEEEN